MKEDSKLIRIIARPANANPSSNIVPLSRALSTALMASKEISTDAQHATVRRENRVPKLRALWIAFMALEMIYPDAQHANVSGHPKRERSQNCVIPKNAHCFAKLDMQRIPMDAKNAVAVMVGS